MKYVLPILFRYSSLVLQFLVVVLVTRRLGREEAGVYFEVFGVINATYFLFGVGLPDGLVRYVAHADATERRSEIRSMIGRSTVVSAMLAVATVAIGVVAGIFFESVLVTWTVIGASAAWWFCYGATFFASQILVATGRSSLGAFFFYPAMNIALFVTSVPYLVFAGRPELEHTLLAAVAGGALCSGVAIACAVAATVSYPVSEARTPIEPAFRLGLSIGIARVLQSCLYWIPVWAVGLWQGVAAAALFATASRLNVAVAAVMAAIRFTIRPTIVQLAAQDDWPTIGQEGRRTATMATVTTVLAILGTVTLGPTLVALVFGEAYRGAAWILAILLVGTLSESVGGAVDEILKMTGRAGLVLRILAVTVAIEAALVALSSRLGTTPTAVAQALTFAGMYGTMLWIVKRREGTWVGASVDPSELRALLGGAAAANEGADGRRMTTIGVFQHWGLGDLVMTVPVLSELRRLHPTAQIVLMVKGKAQAALMEGSPLVDEILQVPPNADRSALLRFFFDLRRRRFDMVYVATRITPLVPLLLRLVSGVRTIVGDGGRLTFLYTCRNGVDPKGHRVDRMLETLAMWTGVAVGKPEFSLPVAEAARRSAEARLVDGGLAEARYFAFHPGSSRGPGIEKRLPVPLVAGVIEALRKREPGLGFVALFGPDDTDLIPQFEPFAADVVALTGCNLDETKVILSRAVGFMGSDSALGHIAASWGVPTVTAVGPTNPNETRPWGPLSRVVTSRETLDCRPCWFTPLKGKCPYGRRCMTGITVEQIMDDISLLPSPGGVPSDSPTPVAATET